MTSLLSCRELRVPWQARQALPATTRSFKLWVYKLAPQVVMLPERRMQWRGARGREAGTTGSLACRLHHRLTRRSQNYAQPQPSRAFEWAWSSWESGATPWWAEIPSFPQETGHGWSLVKPSRKAFSKQNIAIVLQILHLEMFLFGKQVHIITFNGI